MMSVASAEGTARLNRHDNQEASCTLDQLVYFNSLSLRARLNRHDNQEASCTLDQLVYFNSLSLRTWVNPAPSTRHKL